MAHARNQAARTPAAQPNRLQCPADTGKPIQVSPCAGMTLYQALRELQIVLALILGACPLCTQPLTLDRLATILTPT